MTTSASMRLLQSYTPKVDRTKMTLTDKLGGPETLQAAVNALYSRLAQASQTNVFFQDADIAALSVHVDFLFF